MFADMKLCYETLCGSLRYITMKLRASDLSVSHNGDNVKYWMSKQPLQQPSLILCTCNSNKLNKVSNCCDSSAALVSGILCTFINWLTSFTTHLGWTWRVLMKALTITLAYSFLQSCFSPESSVLCNMFLSLLTSEKSSLHLSNV